jgi:hypothetical protein
MAGGPFGARNCWDLFRNEREITLGAQNDAPVFPT